MQQTQRRRLIVTSSVVLAAGFGAALSVLFGVVVPVVIGAILLVALVAYAVVNAPARRRLAFLGAGGTGPRQQIWRFGKSYPEELSARCERRVKWAAINLMSVWQREKFKRCCAAN